jgi:hypothetical protein
MNSSCCGAIAMMYALRTMRYAATSIANLLILLVGIGLGLMLAPRYDRRVEAVAQQPNTPPKQTSTLNGPEQVQPGFQVGTGAAFLMLTHHLQSDELVVNGLDMLILQQGELNLLARIPGVTANDLQPVVSNAQHTHLYQVETPAAPKAPAK